MSARETPCFGDQVTVTGASEDNPRRYGYFVKRGLRHGRLNPGPYYEITDKRGRFWQTSPDNVALGWIPTPPEG